MKPPISTTKYYSNDGILHADNCNILEQAAKDNKIALYSLSRQTYPGPRLPQDYLPELLSIGLWDCRRTQSWYLQPHRNEGIEMTYLAKGNLKFGVDNEEFQLSKGDITFTRPWQQHYLGEPAIGYSKLFWLIIDVKVRRPDDLWQWPDWIVLSPQDMLALTNRLQHTELHVWASNQAVQHIVERLCKYLINNSKNETRNHSTIAILINELLLLLLSLLKSKSYSLNQHLSSKNHTLERFFNALPKICGQDWSLDIMATECGLKRSQFSEYCYQIKGMSPMDYLKQCRIKLAKDLLITTELTITDIAFQAGFGSSQYFATVFKKETGETPINYKRER